MSSQPAPPPVKEAWTDDGDAVPSTWSYSDNTDTYDVADLPTTLATPSKAISSHPVHDLSSTNTLSHMSPAISDGFHEITFNTNTQYLTTFQTLVSYAGTPSTATSVTPANRDFQLFQSVPVPQRIHLTQNNVLISVSCVDPILANTSSASPISTSTSSVQTGSSSIKASTQPRKPPVCQLFHLQTVFDQPTQILPPWAYTTTPVSSLSPTNASKNPLHTHLARRASNLAHTSTLSPTNRTTATPMATSGDSPSKAALSSFDIPALLRHDFHRS